MEKNIQYPYHVSPVPRQRPILPLFPHGCFPQGSGGVNSKQAPKPSSRRRKSYRRSVLHKAALAVPTLPPPVVGSLRQAAQACVQRLQAASALPSTPSGYKRPFSDSSSPSPSNHPPLPQRIRKDFQIEESEVESPEKEILRSAPILGNSPTPVSPLVKDFPSPAPLVLTPVPPVPLFFTPPKSHERSEMPANIAEEVSAEKVVALEGSESDLEKFDVSDSEDAHEVSAKEDDVVEKMAKEDEVVEKMAKEDEVEKMANPVSPKTLSCLNCEEEMTPGHQCLSTDSESNWEDVESDVQSEDWAEQFTNSIRRFHGLNPKVTPLKKSH